MFFRIPNTPGSVHFGSVWFGLVAFFSVEKQKTKAGRERKGKVILIEVIKPLTSDGGLIHKTMSSNALEPQKALGDRNL